MGLTNTERTELRERAAATLAKRSWPEVDLVLDQFGYRTTVEEPAEPIEAAEVEEYILEVLSRDNDDSRLEDLDYDLHAKASHDVLEDELKAEGAYFDRPGSFLTVLAEEPLPPLFEETHNRIRAVRLFLDLLEGVVQKAIEGEPRPVAEAYEAMRSERYPHLPRKPVDFAEIVHRSMLSAEFPLIAWAPSLGCCFSVLERFLSDATSLAADIADRAAPAFVRNPKIESWIAALDSLGFNLILPPQTLLEIRTLRPIRNAFIHRLAADIDDLPAGLRDDVPLHSDTVQPTPALARRALRTVSDIVSATETAFGIHSFDREMKQHGSP